MPLIENENEYENENENEYENENENEYENAVDARGALLLGRETIANAHRKEARVERDAIL